MSTERAAAVRSSATAHDDARTVALGSNRVSATGLRVRYHCRFWGAIVWNQFTLPASKSSSKRHLMYRSHVSVLFASEKEATLVGLVSVGSGSVQFSFSVSLKMGTKLS